MSFDLAFVRAGRLRRFTVRRALRRVPGFTLNASNTHIASFVDPDVGAVADVWWERDIEGYSFALPAFDAGLSLVPLRATVSFGQSRTLGVEALRALLRVAGSLKLLVIDTQSTTDRSGDALAPELPEVVASWDESARWAHQVVAEVGAGDRLVEISEGQLESWIAWQRQAGSQPPRRRAGDLFQPAVFFVRHQTDPRRRPAAMTTWAPPGIAMLFPPAHLAQFVVVDGRTGRVAVPGEVVRRALESVAHVNGDRMVVPKDARRGAERVYSNLAAGGWSPISEFVAIAPLDLRESRARAVTTG